MCAVKRPPMRGPSRRTSSSSVSSQRSRALSREERLLHRWHRAIECAAFVAASSLGGGHAQADDIAQVARLGVLRAGRTLGTPSRAYINRTIANAIRRWLEVERRGFTPWATNACDWDMVADEAEEKASLAEADSNDSDTRAEVAQWVTTLPPRLREVYNNVYCEGCSQRETAARMHVSQPRVAQLHEKLLQLARRGLAHLAG